MTPPLTQDDDLATGELTLLGRVLPASNATFLAEVSTPDGALRCVYKPVRGERPLWDFPDGTLAARERAAYVVSEMLGWDIVPRTILREGPFGVGMVQLWREADADVDAVDLCPVGQVPAGYRHVLDASDQDGTLVSLVHEDSRPLRRMAVFDVLVNNADRKGGHVLAMSDGHRYGVDHGVCFHLDDKLRTVLWGWAGEPLHADDVPAVADLEERLQTLQSPLDELTALLSPDELQALAARTRRLLSDGTMPLPTGTWPTIPWPAF